MNQHGGDTRTALLRAATAVFADHGYAGATVRRITALAGVNLGAVTYHFGSKAALFEAVIVGAQSSLLKALAAAAAGPGSARVRLEALVRAHFGFMSDHPELRQLFLRVLVLDRVIPDQARAYLRRATGLVGQLIAEGQRDGSVRSGDPRLLTVAVMAQPVMLNALRPVLRAGAGIDLDNPAVREQALETTVRFVRAGLSPQQESSP
jgi:AcrR family transcriptional regulator